MIYRTSSGKNFYIEVELTQKSHSNYQKIIANIQRDNPTGVVYLTKSASFSKTIAKHLDIWNRLFFISKDDF